MPSARASARISEMKSTSTAPVPVTPISITAAVSVRGLVNAYGTSRHAVPETDSGTSCSGAPSAPRTRNTTRGDPVSTFTHADPGYLDTALKVDAVLPDARRGTTGSQPHARRALLERHLHGPYGAGVAEGGPVGGKVLGLESRAANLLGEQPVDHGVVDVLEKLPIDVAVDGSGLPIGVDQQDGDTGFHA